ncbi:MAG: MATE family efflux transporter [Oscillospiraceae bacterium]|nr:MATE family efflux transporter [Candidatus Equicaccousia limihippi]
MTDGPITKNVILYSLPIMATNILQLVYNMADIVVVARYAGGTAMAAVGSNGSLINLIVNVFVGLSVGANIMVSNGYGAKDKQGVSQSVHTAILTALISGVAVTVIGLFVARPALELMGSPYDVIDQATVYLKIYFLGMPAMMVVNFGSAILRGVGDSKSPLIIISASGILNIVLNLVFVIVFHLDVAGVAIATTVSQVASAVWILILLCRSNDCYKLSLKKLRIHKRKFLLMMRLGIPAGIQGSCFSLSNIIIQSSINSFGSAVVAGSAASAQIEGIIYNGMNSVYHACLSFTAQNLGAEKPERIRKVFLSCIVTVTAIAFSMCGIIYVFRNQLLGLFTAASGTATTIPAQSILHYGNQRLMVFIVSYFLMGILDVITGANRGLGVSVYPMIVSLLGVCGLRLLWIFTVFENVWRDPLCIYLSYPISWVITIAAQFIGYMIFSRKAINKLDNIKKQRQIKESQEV